MKYKIAIASTDGKVVNQHFGKADNFYIIIADTESMTYEYIEKREVTPICEGGDHDDNIVNKVIENLEDCQYVLVSKIGFRMERILYQKGVTAFEVSELVDEAVKKLSAYIKGKRGIKEWEN